MEMDKILETFKILPNINNHHQDQLWLLMNNNKQFKDQQLQVSVNLRQPKHIQLVIKMSNWLQIFCLIDLQMETLKCKYQSKVEEIIITIKEVKAVAKVDKEVKADKVIMMTMMIISSTENKNINLNNEIVSFYLNLNIFFELIIMKV